MKKTIMLIIVSMMTLVSLGGCWIGPDEGGRGGRDHGYDRDRGHDRDGGHDRDHDHDRDGDRHDERH